MFKLTQESVYFVKNDILEGSNPKNSQTFNTEKKKTQLKNLS